MYNSKLKIIKKRQLNSLLLTPFLIAALCLFIYTVVNNNVFAHPKGLLFPLAGGGNYTDDFNGSRANGKHNATDIFAPKMTPILAAVSGTIIAAPAVQPSYGYIVVIRDSEGFEYSYIHINNDTPGSDDGQGGPMTAYGPDIKPGNPVARGQLIGYVGDSGNAEATPSHLHFEITKSDDTKINPFPYLQEAERWSGVGTYPALSNETLPYGPSINSTVSIEAGKFEASGINQIVTGAGQGVSPHVQLLRPDGSAVGGFYAYDPSFHGGVNVATGDIDNDGIDEIITGTTSGAPHVRIFKVSGAEVGSFYAYDPSFTGGVNVSSVDVDGNGTDEIIVGAGPGGSPHVRLLKADGSEVSGFYAYDPSFHGGVDVSGGDVTGSTAREIITAPGPGGSSHIRIFTTAGVALGNGISGYDNFTGGTRISVGNVRTSSPKDEILVSPWINGSPHIRLLNADGSVVREAMYYESWWAGRYDVAASTGKSYISTGGNRRASVRVGPN